MATTNQSLSANAIPLSEVNPSPQPSQCYLGLCNAEDCRWCGRTTSFVTIECKHCKKQLVYSYENEISTVCEQCEKKKTQNVLT